MNNKILKTLEYEEIRRKIKQETATFQGKEVVDKLHPSSDYIEVTEWLEETEDGLKVQRLRGGIPIPKLDSIKPHLKRLEIGASLNGIELAQITRVLSTTQEILNFFLDLQDAEIEFKHLYVWMDEFTTLPELTKTLKISIDEDGYVTDEASPELRSIRSQIRSSEGKVREELDSIIRGGQSKYLSDAIVTMRNDRYVIPVKVEHKSHFGGVVHDQSASGQTVFIEPRQVVELNNRLRQQQIAERKEIERLLAVLSGEIVPYIKEIDHNAVVIGKLDFINAKSRYSKSIKGIVPTVNKENNVSLLQARHPLIDPSKVIANDIFIGDEYQTVVITGPNTGGKTITLKTLGLLQLMAQSGIPISAQEESEISVFSEIFADIGDEQSIEQNLSTFSSHMTNIVSILSNINEKSLVLFDELGAGTDPQEGAALAISILDTVREFNACVMATTHYPELKAYGYNRPKTINASMEFDVDTLSPTYHLLIGVPGRSNAFEISKRLGLSSSIINRAENIVDEESQDLNEMIADLENRRKMTETEYLEVRHYVDEAESLYNDLKEAYAYFFEERETELAKARKTSNELVAKAEEEASDIISDIRRMQRESGERATIKEHQLIDAKTKLQDLHHQEKQQLQQNKVLKKAKEKNSFKSGDEVIVETYGQRGTLLEKKGNKWQVQLGILKMMVDEEDMRITEPEQESSRQRVTTVKSDVPNNVSTEIDLRGKRYEEAMAEVEQYLDAALLANYSQVRIIHGKGTGALRQGITELLRRYSAVSKFEFAPPNQGGNGATIVTFK